MTLGEVKRFVSESNYSAAFNLVRKHKLNFNLLFDLDPKGFVEAVKDGTFFNNLNSEFIDLFIWTAPDDVSPELSALFSDSEIARLNSVAINLMSSNPQTGSSKMNFVCETLLAQMKLKPDRFTYNILMIYSKTKPNRLDEGLKIVKELKDSSATQSHVKRPPHIIMSSQPEQKTLHYKDLLKYFCWLVSAESLYNPALSLYDLDLAVMIAEFTNMDPKDYLPYIESLKTISRRIDFEYKICCDLKMYKSTCGSGEKATQTTIKRLSN